MNVAKNKRSILDNLMELITSFSEEEGNTFMNFAKKKRENPKYTQLFIRIHNLILKKETYETLDEKAFKKEIELNLTDNFDKLAENLYSRLLDFIAEQHSQNNWQILSIEAEQYFLKIESLIYRNLFSQAAALILNLEAKIKKHEDEDKVRFYNDSYIYSRLANYKINIESFNSHLYSVDENDRMLHQMLQFGDYFYSNSYSHSSEWSFNGHSAIGYRILSKYLIEKDEYKAASRLIKDKILNLKHSNNIAYEDKIMLLNYFELYDAFLQAKNGDSNAIFHYKIKESNENLCLQQIVLLEQQINEIQLALSLKNNATDIVSSLDAYGLVQFSQDKFLSIPARKEINNSIILYLLKEYEKSLEVVHSLKRQNKDKKSLIYLNLLFLELLIITQLQTADYKNITRSIKSIVDQNEALLFEQKAVRLIEKWAELPPYMRKNFPFDKKDDYNLLEKFSKEIEVMHNLILFTLKGKA